MGIVYNYLIKIFNQLQKLLRDFIKSKCQVRLPDSQQNEVYERTYIPFFSLIGNPSAKYHGRYPLVTDWKAYTTNYDEIFEGFWDKLNEPIDHFDKQGNSNTFIFNRNKALPVPSFVKLHGSINWTTIKKNGNVIKHVKSGFNPFETEGDVMLFPIQQKDMYLHPWFTLFQDFKNGLLLCDEIFVVGYAFNDEFILNVFKETLSNSSKIINLINPSGISIKEKFPDEVKSRIKVLPIKFGSNYFREDLKEFVDQRKKITIFIETNASTVRFSLSGDMDFCKVIRAQGFAKSENINKDGYINEIILESPDNNINQITLECGLYWDYRINDDVMLDLLEEPQHEIEFTIKAGERHIDTFKVKPTEPRGSLYRYRRNIPYMRFFSE